MEKLSTGRSPQITPFWYLTIIRSFVLQIFNESLYVSGAVCQASEQTHTSCSDHLEWKGSWSAPPERLPTLNNCTRKQYSDCCQVLCPWSSLSLQIMKARTRPLFCLPFEGRWGGPWESIHCLTEQDPAAVAPERKDCKFLPGLAEPLWQHCPWLHTLGFQILWAAFPSPWQNDHSDKEKIKDHTILI